MGERNASGSEAEAARVGRARQNAQRVAPHASAHVTHMAKSSEESRPYTLSL